MYLWLWLSNIVCSAFLWCVYMCITYVRMSIWSHAVTVSCPFSPFFLFNHPFPSPSYLTLSPPSHSSFAARIRLLIPPFSCPSLSFSASSPPPLPLLLCFPPSSTPLSDTPMDYKIKSALVCDTLSLAGVPLQDPYTAVRAASAGYTRAAAATKRSGPSVKLVSEQLQAGAAVRLFSSVLLLFAAVGGYVRMYVCMYVRTYLCMYVFMYPCTVFIHMYFSKTVMGLTFLHIKHVSLF